MPKPLRFLGTCQFFAPVLFFSVTCFCLEAAVNHQNITGYPAVQGEGLMDSGLPKLWLTDVSYSQVEPSVLEWFFCCCCYLFILICFFKEKVVCFLHTTNCSWKIRNCSSQSFRFIAMVDFLLFLIGYGPSAFKLLSCIKEWIAFQTTVPVGFRTHACDWGSGAWSRVMVGLTLSLCLQTCAKCQG